VAIEVKPATEDDVRVFSAWRYEPPYDAYSITEGPDKAIGYFLGSDVRCHVLVEDGDVVGFVTFGSDAQVPSGDYAGEALDIGLGIDPALTGQGNSKAYISSVLVFARKTFDPQRFRVTIAANNTRAVRAWVGVGFQERENFLSPKTVMGTKRFVIFELD
jgi:RimJ/RimL family protein N-acetyltransferase